MKSLRETSFDYNFAFEHAVRGKANIVTDKRLEEGFVSDTNSYQMPYGFKGDFSDTVSKDNLFRRYGTVINAPNRDGYIRASISTGMAGIIDSGISFPQSNDTFKSIPFRSFKLASLLKLYSDFVNDTKFDIQKYFKTNMPAVLAEQKKKY